MEFRDGFVGCMRALMLNGELQDLRGRADSGMYGVHGGCLGKCASSPCLNNGTCVEGYDSFSCECRWTAFKGPICADGECDGDGLTVKRRGDGDGLLPLKEGVMVMVCYH